MKKITSALLAQSFKGKPLISIPDGQKIGAVEDLMVDPDKLEIAAVVTSKGGLLTREVKAVPADDVQVWGKDVLLVSRAGAVKEQSDFPELEDWLSASDDIKGHDVIDLDGTKQGTVSDLLLDETGMLAGVELNQAGYAFDQVLSEGSGPPSPRISVDRVRSLGRDALIVDMERSREQPEPVSSTEDKFE